MKKKCPIKNHCWEILNWGSAPNRQRKCRHCDKIEVMEIEERWRMKTDKD